MDLYQLTNDEIAQRVAASIRAWRVSPHGAGLSQSELAKKSGVGLTPLKRFEKTGATTLRNLIAILRAMDLLDNLEAMVPNPETPGPLEILADEQKRAKQARRRAPKQAKQAAS